MAWYRTGTVAVTNGGTTVTGTGTAWVANAAAGMGIVLPDGRLYEIIAVVSNTQITLAVGYLGSTASGQAYAVVPTRGPELQLVQDVSALIADYGAAFLAVGQGRFENGTAVVPAVRFTSDENTGLYRIGADILGFSAGGSERARLTTSGIDITGLITGTAVNQSRYDVTAGRVVRNGDHGLGGLVNAAYDLNDPSPQTGWILSNANAPDGAGWLVQNIVRSPTGSSAQIASRTFTAGTGQAPRLAVRHRGSSDLAWSSWAEIFHRLNIVGTVSQSAGVPTGAVVERGSNANGEFVRYADGTQECWRTLTGATGAGSAWTFPAAFSVAPVVTGTAVATVLSSVCLDAAPSATSATVSARDKADARRADVMHLQAVGRWF